MGGRADDKDQIGFEEDGVGVGVGVGVRRQVNVTCNRNKCGDETAEAENRSCNDSSTITDYFGLNNQCRSKRDFFEIYI